MDMDVKALIAQQRAALEEPSTESVNVVLAGNLVPVEVARLLPDDWQQLVATHPPRATSKSDGNIGYDQDALPRDYPVTHIKVAGEPVDSETWTEMWAVLPSPHRNNVGTVMWGLNVFTAIQELQELGKAAAGQSSGSPANRASRRAGSKAGSQRK